ncbi:MAG: NADH-quinone oxidoreductase subunit J [Thiotrichaceae bacterium]|nr:NADH-quinone oxidoreductase subunit J [Thiotrichaceae bacterium]
MSIEPVLFYIFSTILVIAAAAVVTVRNPVYAALCLVLAFFTCAAIWLMLEAEFLALVLILVYVGAVMVLFLFVIMMLDINLARSKEGFIKYLPAGGFVALLIFIEMCIVLGPENFGIEVTGEPLKHAADYSNTKELGVTLYTQYVYPFEIAGALLLLAIVAAIALTMRKRPDSKYQDPAMQVAVRREDRVRIVKMATEKKQ